MQYFSVLSFIFTFSVLLALLLAIKAFLVAYRIAAGKWPASLQFLRDIIDWRIEAMKLAALAAAAVLLTFLGSAYFW